MPGRNQPLIGVLDIPVPVRFLLSIIPSYVLYRILRLLLTTLPRSSHALGFLHGRLLEVLLVGAAIACLTLYQIWRSVTLSDFKPKRDSEVTALFDRKEP
jgi:hypothetical protein